MISKDPSENIKAVKLKIVKNKWFILIILLVASGFYWFQVRPSQIKTKCESKTFEAMKKAAEIPEIGNSAKKFWDWRNDYYNSCLHRYGL